MNQETRMHQKDFSTCIRYEMSRYIDDFNTIMFNQLLEQEKHNENFKIKEVDAKLDVVTEKALEYYKKIISEFDSDEDGIKNFIELIMIQLMTAVQKDQIKRFSSKMYGVEAEISKAEILAESNTRF